MLRKLTLFFLVVMAANCLLGGRFSTEPGAPMLFLKFFILGSLSILLPLGLTPSTEGSREKPGAPFAAGFCLYWCALAAVGFAPILRAAPPSWAFPILGLTWALALAGCMRGLPLSKASWTRSSIAEHGFAILACVLFTCSAVWGSGVGSPSSTERLLAGSTHVDTLIHATNAAMIRDYGIPALPIDGLEFYRYHYLSHAVFAAVSKLTGASTLQVYTMFYPAIFPVLFLLSASLLTLRLVSAGSGLSTPMPTLILVSLASGVLTPRVLGYFVAWEPLSSESYGVCLTLLFTGLSVLSLPTPDAEAASASSRRLALALLWQACLTICKVSVGCLSGLVMTGAFLFRRFLRPRAWLETILLWAVFLAGYRMTTNTVKSEALGFSFLDFPRTYAYGGLKGVPVFLIVHWLPLWLGIAGLALRHDIRSGRRLVEVLAQDSYFVLVLLPAVALAGMAMNLTILGGSAYYFTNLPWVMALPWAGALFIDSDGALCRRTRALFFLVAGSAIASQAYPRASGVWNNVVKSRFEQTTPLDAREELAFLLRARERLSAAPKCALHVSRDWLWHSRLASAVGCLRFPHFLMGIFERPLYESLMRPECRHTPLARGYHHPQRDTGPKDPDEPATLCREAREDGFSCVETLKGVEIRRTACGAARGPSIFSSKNEPEIR